MMNNQLEGNDNSTIEEGSAAGTAERLLACVIETDHHIPVESCVAQLPQLSLETDPQPDAAEPYPFDVDLYGRDEFTYYWAPSKDRYHADRYVDRMHSAYPNRFEQIESARSIADDACLPALRALRTGDLPAFKKVVATVGEQNDLAQQILCIMMLDFAGINVFVYGQKLNIEYCHTTDSDPVPCSKTIHIDARGQISASSKFGEEEKALAVEVALAELRFVTYMDRWSPRREAARQWKSFWKQ